MPITINGSGPITGADGLLTQGTAVASTSGTAINFTGIPSWVKRVTVMFNGVSTNGTDNWIIQVGAGSILTTGYNGCVTRLTNGGDSTGSFTAGWGINCDNAGNLLSGSVVLSLFGSNTWIAHGVLSAPANSHSYVTSGSATLSGALDRVRITPLNGVQTFDAGSINIMYE